MKGDPDRKKQFVGLDLVRFAAAFLVMLFHLAYWLWTPEQSTARTVSGGLYQFPELRPLSWFGWVGVQIFFVISGFVIVYSAQRSAWQFARSRILRLVPAVWIVAPISASILLIVGTSSFFEVTKSLAKTLVFWPISGWVDGVYWTLGIEIVFYSLIFVLLVTKSMNWLNVVLSAIGIVSAVWWFAGHPLVGPRLSQLTLLSDGCLFALGGLLYSLLCTNAPSRYWFVVAVCIAGGAADILHNAADRGFWVMIPVFVWLASLMAIWISVYASDALQHWFKLLPTRTIGLMTYPLYLIHNVVGAGLMRLSWHFGLNRWAALALASLIVITLAFVVAVVAEPRLRRLLASKLDRHYSRLTTSSVAT